MVYTEEEAKQKFCYRDEPNSTKLCSGSSCMAWRWIFDLNNYRPGNQMTKDGVKLGTCNIVNPAQR